MRILRLCNGGARRVQHHTFGRLGRALHGESVRGRYRWAAPEVPHTSDSAMEQFMSITLLRTNTASLSGGIFKRSLTSKMPSSFTLFLV